MSNTAEIERRLRCAGLIVISTSLSQQLLYLISSMDELSTELDTFFGVGCLLVICTNGVDGYERDEGMIGGDGDASVKCDVVGESYDCERDDDE